jgi:hypothetical protein
MEKTAAFTTINEITPNVSGPEIAAIKSPTRKLKPMNSIR